MAQVSISALRGGVVIIAILACPGIVQAFPDAPAPWCREWTDNCATCSRAGGDVNCAEKPGACRIARTRCLKADETALRAACEKVYRDDNACNVCARDARGQETCTQKACPVRDIRCLAPRR